MASGLIGDLLATGSIRSFARPFGGGEAVVLPSSAWEIDDVRERFASCAMDPSRPFEAGAVGTHWIFLDLDDWNDIVEASVAEVDPSVRVRSARVSKPIVAVETALGVCPPPATIKDRLLRLPEVERRTGLSKSTIYRRIGGGRFPASVPLEGNIALWRESDVADWIADPR
jgi:prophage regulatory protein